MKQLESYGQGMDGELVLTLPQLESRKQYLVSMEGKGVTEILKKTVKSKTNKQVRTHFGLLIKTIIVKTNDEAIDTSEFLKLIVRSDLPSGVGLTSDFLHQLFLNVCPVYDDEGRKVTLSKMTTDQASKWFEECRNLLSSRGIYVSDPNPNWKNEVK
jgi:galactokinase